MVETRLKQLRERRGLGAAQLARAVGVRRQTIYAIEAGTYVPNTAVALKLARELGAGVEELFALAESAQSRSVPAELLDPAREVRPGEMLRLCRVGTKTIAVPWSPEPFALPHADAIALAGPPSRPISAQIRNEPISDRPRLLVAGCDPAMSLLARHLALAAGIDLVTVPCSSRSALEWLRAGKVHIAGTHIHDAEPTARRCGTKKQSRPERANRIVTFAEWEEGFVVQTGNPKSIRTAADLARRDVRIVSRPPGSGSRALLDRLLESAGIPQSKVNGYESSAAGHLAAAWQIRQGTADCCIATRVAAAVFGLEFIPLAAERYDLVATAAAGTDKGIDAVFEVLQSAKLRKDLGQLEGYESRLTGSARER